MACIRPATLPLCRRSNIKHWKVPAHFLEDLVDTGFYPPYLAQHAEASADALLAKVKAALPVARSSNFFSLSLSPLAALDMASGLCNDMASSLNDDLAHRPTKPQAMTLDIPDDDYQRDLEDWCSTDNLSLPTAHLMVLFKHSLTMNNMS